MSTSETIQKAEELYKKKKFHDALKLYEQCVNDDNSRVRIEAYYGMACCYSCLHDIYNAKEFFQNVISIFPGSAEAAIARAFIDDAAKWIAGEIDLFSMTSDIQRAPQWSACANHENEMAVYKCPSCSKNICLQCTFPVVSQYYCVECGRKIEQEERKSSSLVERLKKKDADIQDLKAKATPPRKKAALHFLIFAMLLVFSISYRFALRDAAAKRAGIEITDVTFNLVAINEVKAFTAAEKKAGIDYMLSWKIRNTGGTRVSRVHLQVKLYDTFGQKITERMISLDSLGKKVKAVLTPNSTRPFQAKFKDVKAGVSMVKIRVVSFQSE